MIDKQNHLSGELAHQTMRFLICILYTRLGMSSKTV